METKDYIPTIGLEIHAELKTKTKLFCNSRNDPDEKTPNINICPVCMGYPGTLPVINKEAIKHVLKIGLALHGTLADLTEFDRKNYFYPDIPKGYQISQYKYPLVSGGALNGIDITRIHLEEDTARSTHDKSKHTLVDFNREGIPLMELVTEPVIHTAEEASQFARELQLLLRYLGAGDANLEKGEMRVEANISVSRSGELGTKVEVKNLNSFKAVERAIAFEIKRHIEVLEEGGKITQETRGWDENTGETFSQREKESSHDYRYFPDPDLPKFKLREIPEFSEKSLRQEIPELPWDKRERLIKKFGITKEASSLFVQDTKLGLFFEEVTREESKEFSKLASNYITSDIQSLLKSNSIESLPQVEYFKTIIKMIQASEISSRGAKELVVLVSKENKDPKKIAEEKGLLQVSDTGSLGVIVQKIISQNESVVNEYKSGKEASLQYLIGQAMKEAKGSANPQLLKEIFLKNIS